jgi:hypothetical protein
MGDDLGRNLGRLGALAAANRADRALRRTCIGRIVSLLTLIFIVLCVGLDVLTFYALDRRGLLDTLPQSVRPVLIVGLMMSFVVDIVLAGLIGNWLRRRIWRLLMRGR